MHNATNQPLLFAAKTSKDLFPTEKNANSIVKLPDDAKKWPQTIFAAFVRHLPYMAEFDPEVVLDRVEEDAGSALGYVQIRNRTAARPQDDAARAGNVIRVPIIVTDRKLQKFLVFEVGGECFPLSEQRVQQAMLNPSPFDTDVKRLPASPSLIDQLMPPFQSRQGFGSVSSGSADGISKISSAEKIGRVYGAEAPGREFMASSSPTDLKAHAVSSYLKQKGQESPSSLALSLLHGAAPGALMGGSLAHMNAGNMGKGIAVGSMIGAAVGALMRSSDKVEIERVKRILKGGSKSQQVEVLRQIEEAYSETGRTERQRHQGMMAATHSLASALRNQDSRGGSSSRFSAAAKGSSKYKCGYCGVTGTSNTGSCASCSAPLSSAEKVAAILYVMEKIAEEISKKEYRRRQDHSFGNKEYMAHMSAEGPTLTQGLTHIGVDAGKGAVVGGAVGGAAGHLGRHTLGTNARGGAQLGVSLGAFNMTKDKRTTAAERSFDAKKGLSTTTARHKGIRGALGMKKKTYHHEPGKEASLPAAAPPGGEDKKPSKLRTVGTGLAGAAAGGVVGDAAGVHSAANWREGPKVTGLMDKARAASISASEKAIKDMPHGADRWGAASDAARKATKPFAQKIEQGMTRRHRGGIAGGAILGTGLALAAARRHQSKKASTEFGADTPLRRWLQQRR